MDLEDHVFCLSILFHALMFSIIAKEILFPAPKCAEIEKKSELMWFYDLTITPKYNIIIDMRTGFRDERRLVLSSEIKVAEGLNNPWAFVVKKVTAMINIKDKLFSISTTCSLTKKTSYVYFYSCITVTWGRTISTNLPFALFDLFIYCRNRGEAE